MAKQRFLKRFETTINVGISATDTVISLASVDFATTGGETLTEILDGGDYVLAVLIGDGRAETVKITGINGTAIVVERAQEGDAAVAFATDDTFTNSITAGMMDSRADNRLENLVDDLSSHEKTGILNKIGAGEATHATAGTAKGYYTAYTNLGDHDDITGGTSNSRDFISENAVQGVGFRDNSTNAALTPASENADHNVIEVSVSRFANGGASIIEAARKAVFGEESSTQFDFSTSTTIEDDNFANPFTLEVRLYNQERNAPIEQEADISFSVDAVVTDPRSGSPADEASLFFVIPTNEQITLAALFNGLTTDYVEGGAYRCELRLISEELGLTTEQMDERYERKLDAENARVFIRSIKDYREYIEDFEDGTTRIFYKTEGDSNTHRATFSDISADGEVTDLKAGTTITRAQWVRLSDNSVVATRLTWEATNGTFQFIFRTGA